MASSQNTQLDVRLVAREDGGNEFQARVIRAEDNLNGHGRAIRIHGSDSAGTVLADLILDGYIIKAIIIKFPEGPKEQTFRDNPQDQKEAFETIQQFLKDEEEEEKEEESPRRVEIVIRRKREGWTETRLVVVSFSPPLGQFNYSAVRGRAWRPYRKNLSVASEHFSSTTHEISQIICINGKDGLVLQDTYGYDLLDQTKAWIRLEREFKSLTNAEIEIIRSWKVGNGHAIIGGYSSSGYPSNYWNRVPDAYQPRPPAVAYFRVAGDQLGMEILKEQQERGEPPSLEELIAAEKEKGPTAESAPVAPQTGDQLCDCGSHTCDDCWADGLPGRMLMSQSVH